VHTRQTIIKKAFSGGHAPADNFADNARFGVLGQALAVLRAGVTKSTGSDKGGRGYRDHSISARNEFA
jgi:hypothetical protein